MLTHEYSWHDAVYLADSSDGCSAANIQLKKAKQIHKEDLEKLAISVVAAHYLL